MITNADLTIYNRYIDPASREEKFQRSEIFDVVWESTKAANGRTSGLLASKVITMPSKKHGRRL
jgi:hypothetical protein